MRAWWLLWCWVCVSAQAATYTLANPADTVVGEVQYVTSKFEDTLFDLGRKYGVGYEEIVAANPGVDPWVPGAGKRIVIPTRFVLPGTTRAGIVVNVAEHRLYYYPKVAAGETPTVQTYPVSLGKLDWSTPLGLTRVVAKQMNPTWYPPASVRKEHAARGDYLPAAVPPGKDNPLGEFAMRLAIGGGSYLIHGTNKPIAIGMAVTHGCIRMFPEDIEPFFQQVPVNTPVLIMNQPYKMGWLNGQLYMEAHHPDEGAANWAMSLTDVTRMWVNASEGRGNVHLDWADAERVFKLTSGVPELVRVQQ